MAEKVRAAVPDYDESLRNFERYPLSPIATLAVLELPDAPQVGYVLSKNPSEIVRLWEIESTQGPRAAIAAVHELASAVRHNARIAVQQQQAPQQVQANQQRPRVSPPPPPYRSVSSGVSGAAYKDPSTMDMKTYNQWRNSGGGK